MNRIVCKFQCFYINLITRESGEQNRVEFFVTFASMLLFFFFFFLFFFCIVIKINMQISSCEFGAEWMDRCCLFARADVFLLLPVFFSLIAVTSSLMRMRMMRIKKRWALPERDDGSIRRIHQLYLVFLLPIFLKKFWILFLFWFWCFLVQSPNQNKNKMVFCLKLFIRLFAVVLVRMWL